MTLPTIAPVTGNISPVSSASFNLITAALPKALDAVDGGTYVLTAALTVNGSPNIWTFGLPVVCSNTLVASGGMTIASATITTLTIPLTGTLTIANGAAVTVGSGATFDVNCNCTFDGGVTMSAGLTVDVITISNNTNTIVLASRSVTRILPVTFVSTADTTARTLPFNGGQGGASWLASVDLPHNQVLTAMAIGINPEANGNLPVTKPTLRLVKIHKDTGVETDVFAAFSDPTLIATYRDYHTFGPTGLSHLVDKSTYYYKVTFTAESGTDDENDFVYILLGVFTAGTLEPAD